MLLQDKIGEMILANLISETTNVPGKPVVLPGVWIHHSITPPIEVIIVEGVHPRLCTQDVDSGAGTQLRLLCLIIAEILTLDKYSIIILMYRFY